MPRGIRLLRWASTWWFGRRGRIRTGKPRRIYSIRTSKTERLAAVVLVLVFFGGGGDAHAAEFFGVVFAVQDLPLFAAFDDFFFLGSDALADFEVGFFFFAERGGDNLDDMLANGVAIVDEFDVVAGDEDVGDLVRDADNFFAAESHDPR